MLGACGASEPDSLIGGLDVSAAIQQGGSFEMTLPIREGTGVDLVSHAGEGKAVKGSLDVADDAAVGSYNIVLRADYGGEEVDFEWPFTIVEPDS